MSPPIVPEIVAAALSTEPPLAGRVAVVTGAASGIGAAVARQLRARGVKVGAIDVSAVPAELATCAVHADVGDPDAVSRGVEVIARELGPPTLVVHAAGIARDAMHWKLEPTDWADVLRVNLSGAFHVLRAVTPHLRAAGGGSIVLIGSINGTRGKLGQGAYAASKAGLVGFAKTAARELGRFGGRVNVVAPGMVNTPMTAALAPQWRERAASEAVLGRIAEPEDIAGPVLFLLSPAARHITGQTLHVDGGQCI